MKSDYKKLLNENGIDDLEKSMYVLNVVFNKTLSIRSDLSWTPKGFGVINIEGAGSHINIENHEGDEKKFADWSGDGILVASNLKVSGFNNAFRNIGGR